MTLRGRWFAGSAIFAVVAWTGFAFLPDPARGFWLLVFSLLGFVAWVLASCQR